jgi:hypothetical protein
MHKKDKDIKDNMSFNDLKRESMMENVNMKTTAIGLTKTYEGVSNNYVRKFKFKNNFLNLCRKTKRPSLNYLIALKKI